MPFAEVWNEEKDALVGSGFPSSLQYKMDVFLSNSSQDGLGKQPVLCETGVKVKFPSSPPFFGLKSTVVMFPE